MSKFIEPDDMNCPICKKDIYPTSVESFGVIRWNPETETNELLAMACSMGHLQQIIKGR